MSLPPLPDPLPRPVVDSHCHLDTAQGVSGLDPAEAIERAGSSDTAAADTTAPA